MNKTIQGSERKWGTRPGKLYIGTSGWTYADWKGRFFLPLIPASMPEMLANKVISATGGKA